MSREYTLAMRQREATEAAKTSYAAAKAAADKAFADDFLLREMEARTDELLESRQRIEKAKQALATARAALIQSAWANGTLHDAVDLRSAVQALLPR